MNCKDNIFVDDTLPFKIKMNKLMKNEFYFK